MGFTSDQLTCTASAHGGSQARNFHTSARLHLQHLLFQITLGGSLLEPRIGHSLSVTSDIRVADLGCENGAWLLDLNHALSRSGSNRKYHVELVMECIDSGLGPCIVSYLEGSIETFL
jgi:hypothetical protein